MNRAPSTGVHDLTCGPPRHEATITAHLPPAALTADQPLARTQAQLFRTKGRRAPESGRPHGRQTRAVTPIRGGTTFDAAEMTRTID